MPHTSDDSLFAIGTMHYILFYWFYIVNIQKEMNIFPTDECQAMTREFYDAVSVTITSKITRYYNKDIIE